MRRLFTALALIFAALARPAHAAQPSLDIKLDDSTPKPRLLLLDIQSATLGHNQTDALTGALYDLLKPQGVEVAEPAAAREALIALDAYPFTPYKNVPLDHALKAVNTVYALTGACEKNETGLALNLEIYKVNEAEPIWKWSGANADADSLTARLPEAVTGALAALGRAEGRALTTGAVTAPPPKKEPANINIVYNPKPAPRATPAETPSAPAPQADQSKPTPTPEALPTPRPRQTPEPEVEPEPTPKPRRTPKPEPTPEATPKQTPAATPEPTPAPAEAAAMLEKALKLPPEAEERLKLVEDALKASPKDPAIAHQLAIEYYHRGRFSDSAAACDKALAGKPGNSIILTIQGSAYHEMRDYKRALGAHKAALEADPGNNWARYNQALTLSAIGDPGAIESWKDYITHAGGDPDQAALVVDAKRQMEELEAKKKEQKAK